MRRGSARRGRIAITKSIPAPTGGLNGIDSLASMPATDAITLDNWFPRTGDVITRNGTQTWIAGFANAVETLMAYRASTGKMFAIAGGKIYDVTATGSLPAASKTGLANSRFQYVNFGTPGGRFLVAVNGSDYPQLFDGTNWTNILGTQTGQTISSITRVGTTATLTTTTPHGLTNSTVTTVTVTGATPSQYNVTNAVINVTGASTFTYTMASDPGASASAVGSYTFAPGITGVDPRTFKNVDAINNRLWFVEKNSMRAWYLPLNSISGVAQQIDLSSLAKLGGTLAAVFGWSTGSATNLQNFTVFLTTEGEVFVFAGYDPTSSSQWALSSRARMGGPVGDRFWLRVGTDVLIICRDGVVDLSTAIMVDRASSAKAVSEKIKSNINQAVSAYSGNFGWQIQQFPIGNMLIINVPTQENVTAYQYVMNTLTGAWCRYTGLNANCFEYLNDKLFFGGVSKVYQAEIGSNDDGANIVSTAKQAYNTLGSPGTIKFITAARPAFTSISQATITFNINTDYADDAAQASPSVGSGGTPLYWPFVWGSYWTMPLNTSKYVEYASGVGFAMSAKVTAVAGTYPVSWQNTVYWFQVGEGF